MADFCNNGTMKSNEFAERKPYAFIAWLGSQ